MEKKILEKKFEDEIRQHELIIHKVCRIYTNNDADHKDLFQDIIVQLWKAYPGFKNQCKTSTWMYRIAINTAITGLRKQKNFIETYQPDLLPEGHDTSENDEKEKQFQQLYAAINQLNQIEKAIIMLYLEDRSYDEMEEIMGMSQGNLRVKMSRIKDRLRQLTN